MVKIGYNDIVGFKIKNIYRNEGEIGPSGYLGRLIVLEIENGEAFALDQDELIPRAKRDFFLKGIYFFEDLERTNQIEPGNWMDSLIKDIFFPYDWKYSIGLILENGYVLHNGFSMYESGLMFYKANPENFNHFVFLSGDSNC